MDAQALYFSALLTSGTPTGLKAVNPEHLSPDWRPVFDWVTEFVGREGKLPRPETVEQQFSRPLPPPSQAGEAVTHYAHVIRQNAMRVSMEDGLTEHVVGPLKETKTNEALDGAKRVVADLERNFRKHDHTGLIADVSTGVARRLADYHLRKAARDRIGLPLPWPAISRSTGGLMPGALWFILARPSMGKTWVLVVTATWLWQMGLRVLFVSMETPPEASKPRDPHHRIVHDVCLRCYQRGATAAGICPAAEIPRQQLSVRFDAVGSRISAWRLLKGLLTPQEERALTSYYEALESGRLPWGTLRVVAAPYISSVTDLQMEILEFRPDIILWDSAYLAVEDSHKRNETAGALIRDIKMLLERSGVPGFVSWHFNREVDENATNASANSAILTDEVGRIADVVLGLFRPPEMEAAGEAIFRTLKVRDGIPMRELKTHFKMKDEINFAEIGEPPQRRQDVT